MLAEKEGYLARGDSVSPSAGPVEDVVGSTQLMSAGRFDVFAETQAAIRRFAATSWSQGGLDNDGPGRLLTGAKVAAGIG